MGGQIGKLSDKVESIFSSIEGTDTCISQIENRFNGMMDLLATIRKEPKE